MTKGETILQTYRLWRSGKRRFSEAGWQDLYYDYDHRKKIKK